MITAAIEREESRGVHTRTDFPAPTPSWAHHLPLVRPPIVGELDAPRSTPALP
jgi:L-aspartate oxidase